MDEFEEFTPCIAALLKEEGARVNSQHHGMRNVTLTVLRKQANSFQAFTGEAPSLCAASLRHMIHTSYNRVSPPAEAADASSSILIVPVATLVVAVFIAFVGALYRYFSRGDDTAEYDYGTLRREGLGTNLIHASLFTYPSLISLVSYEDLPSSQRLLYPDTTRRSTPVQLSYSQASTLSSVPVSDEDSTGSIDPRLEEDSLSDVNDVGWSSIYSHRAMSPFWKASVPVLLAVSVSIYVSMLHNVEDYLTTNV